MSPVLRRKSSGLGSTTQWRSTASGRGTAPLTTAALDGKLGLLKFDPSRCSVFFLDTQRTDPEPNRERRYTLTHNDVTRHLTMSVAPDFNGGQTAVWITKVLRDEVLGEWREDGLHVHCFVQVEGHWWLDWAKGLRSLVFRQKLPLVLDTLRYAEADLLKAKPQLLDAPVFVHFHEQEGEAMSDGAGYLQWDRIAMGEREHWGALRDAGRRDGDDQRVDESEQTFSRQRDLWAGDESASDLIGGGSVGALIEGALAGGGDGAAVEQIAASR